MSRPDKPPVPLEAEVQRSILATLDHLGIPCWRHNVGAFPVTTGGARRFFRAGQAGQADIFGILPGSGKLITIEVKRPGKRPTAPQVAFLMKINEAGGLAFWATDARTVEDVIRAVLLNPKARVEMKADGSMDLTDEEG